MLTILYTHLMQTENAPPPWKVVRLGSIHATPAYRPSPRPMDALEFLAQHVAVTMKSAFPDQCNRLGPSSFKLDLSRSLL